MSQSNPRPASKVCRRCEQDLPVTSFSPSATICDGLRSWCRRCESERRSERRAANLDAERERARVAARERHRADPEPFRARSRAAYEADPEAHRQRVRSWQARYPEKMAQATRRWAQNNPEKARAKRVLRYARKRNAMVGPVDLAALWTGRCGICGESLNESLAYPDPLSKSVDHISPIVRGGLHEQSNLQWAHLICNRRKGDRPAA